MKTHPFFLLILIVLLIGTFALPGAAQGPAPTGPAGPSPFDAAPLSPDVGPRKAPDGHWYVPAGSQSDVVAAAAAAPQGSGGPDEFGYTWNDWEPLNWIDASGGTNTGISSTTDHAGPIDIGFPFRFYENVRSQLYISLYGFLAFNNDSLWNWQSEIPSIERPNEVIAPHWVPIESLVGYVRYLRGGAAPNRWFVIEWNRVRSDYIYDDGDEEYTFEAVLHENGDILFQYATMTVNGWYYCQSSGIEDSTGLDGLATSTYCRPIAPNHAVRITRPAAAARVALVPRAQGAFGAAGAAVQFNQTVRNTGELGADTYDLYMGSPWPTTLLQADGITPLTDTNGDGIMDTGPVDQDSSKTIIVKMALPASAVVGDSNAAQITAISSRNQTQVKTASFQAGVPERFAQTYSQSGVPKVGFYRPDQQTTRQTTDPNGWNPAVTTAPDGSIIQVWYRGRDIGNNRWVNELYYAVLDNRGNVILPAARLTDLSAASTSAYDYDPAVAVAPDGRIGIAWRRYLWDNSDSTFNHNIYFMALAANGAIILSPTNLTNNGSWGTYNTPSVPQFYYPSIAATADSRFGLAWERQTYDGNSWPTTTWYAVRRSDGEQVKAPTQFSANTSDYYPNLTSLADGTLFLTQQTGNQLGYGRIDSSGNIVTGLTTLTASSPRYPDAIQLPNGNIVLAWTNWNVGYAVLNAGLGIVQNPTSLPNISPQGDYLVSVTRSGNRAVLTWGDACCGYYPNLYYALLDGSGNVLTPPMIFFSDYAGYNVGLPYNGQGNTPLLGDFAPPAGPSGLTSPSHTLNTWSKDTTVDVTWTAATDEDSGLDGYSVAWDRAPATVPDTIKDIGTLTATTSPALADGDWYFHIRAVDKAGNWAPGAAHLGPFRIDTTPPACRMQSPPFNLDAFPVSWYATDAGSGVSHYDIWQRTTGPVCQTDWTQWMVGTTALNATWPRGCSESTAHFNCLATDRAGNTAVEQPAVEDAATIQADYMATGRVTNNQGQPVFRAQVTTTPAALHPAWTDGAGRYALYFGFWTGQTYAFSASRSGYGTLPAQRDVAVNGQPTGVDFVLPPEQDAVVNGGWETGDLTGWQIEPGAAVAASSLAAHTGLNGLRVGSPEATASIALPSIWQIAQSVTLPAELAKPTLSWFYRVVSGSPGESLLIQISNGANEVTREIPLAPGGWTHAWADLSAFSGQTVTLRIGLLVADPREVYLDEVSIGATRVGVYPVRLPLIARQ